MSTVTEAGSSGQAKRRGVCHTTAVEPKPQLQKVVGFQNLQYAETGAGELKILYGTVRVDTTWDRIRAISNSSKAQRRELIIAAIGPKYTKNKYTAINRLAKALAIGAVAPNKSYISTDADLDAEFKPILSGVINTHVGEGEKIEGILNQ